ncbi:MAG TPA: MFS transporter [Rhizomicrobium sp.]|nr:MFS transporter [Rhizomicrobium sp.]
MIQGGTERRGWLTLALMSALFFIITAATFDSLGVVLPTMVGELDWSWANAGFGFTLPGFFCGITSTIPATLIRRWGVRVCLLVGAVVMACAFLCLARTDGLPLYFAGASLAGLGLTLLATVPGTYLLARLFARPAFAIGLYFTVGGLGGVAGPLLYRAVIDITGQWRSYWLVMDALVVLAALTAMLLVDTATDVGSATDSDPEISTESWDVRAAFRTHQFWILAAAYSAFLFCGITANSVSVAHLTQVGVTAAMAGNMMSLQALINAGARLAGGILTRFISAKTLLAASLALLVIGLLALGAARDVPMMLVYAAGIGIGYGLTFFAASILLLDYFGRGPYLELFATVNLISTVGAVAPTLAGLSRDHIGSFTPFFVGLAILVALVLLAVILMRAPHPRQA